MTAWHHQPTERPLPKPNRKQRVHMTFQPTPAALAIGQRAFSILLTATDLRWFNTGPRLRGWEDTLVQAYAARADGVPDALVTLPPDVSVGGQDLAEDAADVVLDSFDQWLGRGIVDEAFEVAYGGDTVDVGFAQVDQGVALAIARGW